jgi:hypothetical protein
MDEGSSGEIPVDVFLTEERAEGADRSCSRYDPYGVPFWT